MPLTRKPGIFIPTLYFAEGLPYTIVMVMSAVFFKSLGADNVFIGWTSLLYLPWTLKFIWSPLVDFYATKRSWVVVTEFVLAGLVGVLMVLAYVTGQSSLRDLTIPCIVVLYTIALASATQDVSIDGLYLDVLDEHQKAFFVGIRNTAYRVATIFGSGLMVYLAGKLGEHSGLHFGWSVSFGGCAVALLFCAVFHQWYLPWMAEGSPKPGKALEHNFFKAIGTYFQQPSIIPIVAYIVIFRFGDALMLRQAPNFLLDPPSKSGLGVSVADLGMIIGTVGVVALLIGGLLASWLISRDGLKRWMLPLTLTQSGAILLYWALAQWPEVFSVHSSVINNPYLPAVYVINSAEQFAYGMGVAAYTVFLLSTVRSEYKAAHYATASALMALGMLVPGVCSGYLYAAVGYANFFLISFLASLPGIVAIFFLPLWRQKG